VFIVFFRHRTLSRDRFNPYHGVIELNITLRA